MLRPSLYIDGDACPVKTESIRAATRYNIQVYIVSNAGMRTDPATNVKNIIVGQEFDAADNWIVDHIAPNDIVLTADIQLASRCLKLSAYALGPSGKIFNSDNIGSALAMRELHNYLRESGDRVGNNASFSKSDRSQFLQALDLTISQAIKKCENQTKS